MDWAFDSLTILWEEDWADIPSIRMSVTSEVSNEVRNNVWIQIFLIYFPQSGRNGNNFSP